MISSPLHVGDSGEIEVHELLPLHRSQLRAAQDTGATFTPALALPHRGGEND